MGILQLEPIDLGGRWSLPSDLESISFVIAYSLQREPNYPPLVSHLVYFCDLPNTSSYDTHTLHDDRYKSQTTSVATGVPLFQHTQGNAWHIPLSR